MLSIEDLDSVNSVRADDLYIRAFPSDERFPLDMMHRLDGSMGARFRCFSDGGRFVGLAFTIEDDDVLFINFLAVEEDLRGTGYGTGMLDIFKESGKTVFLNMEPVEEGCDNLEQRVKRREFYVRNGFRENGVTVTPDGNRFMGMVYGGPLSI